MSPIIYAHGSATLTLLPPSTTITTSTYNPSCHSDRSLTGSTPISTDIPTLHALLTKPSSSPHIFVPLNNAGYLSRALSTPLTRFHELDWWDERNLRVSLPPSSTNTGATDPAAVNTEVRLTCTPSQHMSSRSFNDRFHALWASWVVEGDLLGSHKKVYFAGDTGYRTVRDGEDEDKAPVCPAFAEVGERFGGLDVALLPIGCVSQLLPTRHPE
jgi:N-acyl-phosphatidylethanolamine-hydrolysing phospholipase D